MRLTFLVVAPLALALPAGPTIPDLSVSQWNSIQSGFGSLGRWSWAKIEQLFDAQAQQAAEDDKTELTIWQQLKGDTNSFSRLVKILEFENKTYHLLDDKDAQITFFAPNNDALKPPHHHEGSEDWLHDLDSSLSLVSVSHILDNEAWLMATDDDDDKEKKHRRKILRKIVHAIVKYHILPKPYRGSELAQNSTIATNLRPHDDSYGGLRRRIRIDRQFVPPGIKLNFYAKLLVTDIKARNGYFHTLDHPLLPPPSIMEETFLFPQYLATFTSSVQKVHGRHFLDYEYDREKSKFWGAPLATAFVPSNGAFSHLPERLRFFLFSRIGEHVLAKILAYHYVPHTLLLSEIIHHEKHHEGGKHKHEHEKHHERVATWIADDPSFHKEIEVPTGLPNATLQVIIDKTKLLPVEGAVKTTIKVNDQIVELIDIPARNGAWHVLAHLLVPPHKHHGDGGEDLSATDTWENWEEWLPAWAEE